MEKMPKHWHFAIFHLPFAMPDAIFQASCYTAGMLE
jgi:hypothetical protein